LESKVRELTGLSFQDILDTTKKLVVVEFYTSTCPNCRIMEPVLEEIAEELKEIAEFTRVNAQTNPALAASHGIMGVPTFKFFCQGRSIGELVGALPATILRNTIKDLVKRRSECISKSTPVSYEIDGYG